MQLAEYHDPQLGGLGKSLKKLGKKLKKVVKPLAHIGAAVATGGASLAVSSQILQQSKAKKQAQAVTKQITAATNAAMGESQENFDAARYIAENYATANWGKGSTAAKNRAKWTADPWGHWLKYGKKLGWAFPYKSGGALPSTTVGPVQTVTQIAPPASAVVSHAQPTLIPTQANQAQQFMPMPQFAPPTQFEPIPEGDGPPTSGLPPWAIPAGLAAVGLVAVLATRGRGKS